MAEAERTAEVTWNGDLMTGNGQLSMQSSGLIQGTPVTWASRTQAPEGKTSPEELLAASHASCYAMAFSATLARRGTPPERLHVAAVAGLDRRPEGGFKVTTMDLNVRGRVPGLDQAWFEEAARQAEQGCPISNAIRGNVDIRLNPTLESA